MDLLVAVMDAAAREVLLFAAFGFLLGGLDDLLVDAVYACCRLRRGATPTLADLPRPEHPGRLAVFVPAWDEVAVIGPMLRATLARYDHPDYRIYVGCYPNDRATLAAAGEVALADPRVRPVVADRPGPTTKADNLNCLWRALIRADAEDGRRTRAVVFHDAEDVVHPAELRVFDVMLDRHDVVQLPVRPLVKPGSRLVSGHYLDEFAEAHAKSLVVRDAVRAGLPLAGVGCAVSTDALARLAAARGERPFDADSLTEDYELGLRLSEMGLSGRLARVRERPGGPVVATRAYFPDTLEASVRQKARWMTGIALAGWDRTGWARPTALSDHWMRARDRRAPLAVLVLAAAYLALLLWAGMALVHLWTGAPPPAPGPVLARLLRINAALLAWRTLVRAACTARADDWREAAWSPIRMLVGGYVSL